MSRDRLAEKRQIAAIFEAFDVDKDSRLNTEELTALIQRCNPHVAFTDVQLQAIIHEVN